MNTSVLYVREDGKAESLDTSWKFVPHLFCFYLHFTVMKLVNSWNSRVLMQISTGFPLTLGKNEGKIEQTFSFCRKINSEV